MTKTSKITLAVLGVIIVALVGGHLGAGLRGGIFRLGRRIRCAGNGAFLQTIKDQGEQRVGAPKATLKNLGVNVQSIDNYTNAIATVQAGRAAAEFTDLPTAEAQAQADPTLKIIVPEPALYSATANYGVPSTADQWSLQTVNIAIQRAKDSGRLAKAYQDVNYFDVENLPSNLVKQAS